MLSSILSIYLLVMVVLLTPTQLEEEKKNKQIIPTTDHIISITYIRNCIIMEIFSQKIKENTENLFLLSIQFTITD